MDPPLGRAQDEKIVNIRQMLKVVKMDDRNMKRGPTELSHGDDVESEHEEEIPTTSAKETEKQQMNLETTLRRLERVAKRNQESIDPMREVLKGTVVDRVATDTDREAISPSHESSDNGMARVLGSSQVQPTSAPIGTTHNRAGHRRE